MKDYIGKQIEDLRAGRIHEEKIIAKIAEQYNILINCLERVLEASVSIPETPKEDPQTYFTPNREDLSLGDTIEFYCENHRGPHKNWAPAKVSAVFNLQGRVVYRVPHLTQKQIEGLGWKKQVLVTEQLEQLEDFGLPQIEFTKETSPRRETLTTGYITKLYLTFNPFSYEVIIFFKLRDLRMNLFWGNCKSANDLRRVEKLLFKKQDSFGN